LKQVRRDLKQRTGDLEVAQKRIVKLTAYVVALQNSFSWKMTRPLRAVVFYWRRLFSYPIKPGPM
jgi:hypothetical protein